MTDPFISKALSGQAVWDIGQFTKETKKGLERLVRQGTLVKSKDYWAGISLKTVYELA